jgi:hypothetical protein
MVELHGSGTAPRILTLRNAFACPIRPELRLLGASAPTHDVDTLRQGPTVLERAFHVKAARAAPNVRAPTAGPWGGGAVICPERVHMKAGRKPE